MKTEDSVTQNSAVTQQSKQHLRTLRETLSPTIQHTRDRAHALHHLGLNITAIADGGKGPRYQWKKTYPQRQSEHEIHRLPWQGFVTRDGTLIPPATNVGLIHGPDGCGNLHAFDLDACQNEQGEKRPISDAIAQVLCTTLGLPADTPWLRRSTSGAGWHLFFRCPDDLPDGLFVERGPEKGVFVGTPHLPDTFDHIELRWAGCQTVFTGPVPDTPPPVVSVERVVAAFHALARPSRHEHPHPAPAPPCHSPPPTNDDTIKETIRERLNLREVAHHLFGSDVQREGPELRVKGHGGLLIKPDTGEWYCFRDACGGDVFDLLSYVRYGTPLNGDKERFKAVLREAATLAGLELAEHVPRPANGRSPPPHPRPPTHNGPAPPNDSESPRTESESSRIVRSNGANNSESLANNRRRMGQLIPTRDLRSRPPPTWIIPHILPANDLVTVYGASGAGKSFFLLDITLCIAQEATVVYVAAEALNTYIPRVTAWCQHYHMDEAHHYMWTQAVNLLDSVAVDWFILQVQSLKPAVIVLDTLARCMVGGDENSAKDMGLAIEACERIRHATGATILLCHHTGKSGTSERGSSALRGACSTMIELSNNGDGLITIKSEKSRSDKPFDTRYFQLIERESTLHDPVTHEPIMSAILLPTVKMTHRYNAALKQRDYDVLDVLAMPYFGGEACNKDIAEHLKLVAARVTESVNKLLEQQYVNRRKEGRNTIIWLLDKGWADVQARSQLAAPNQAQNAPRNSSDDLRIVLNWPVTIQANDSPTIRESSPQQDAESEQSFGRFAHCSDDSESSDNCSFAVPPLKGGTAEESCESWDEQSGAKPSVPDTSTSLDTSAAPAAPRPAPKRARIGQFGLHPAGEENPFQSRMTASRLVKDALIQVALGAYEPALDYVTQAPTRLQEHVRGQIQFLIDLMGDDDKPVGWEWQSTYLLERQRDGYRTSMDCDRGRVVAEALRVELAEAEAVYESGSYEQGAPQPP